MKADTCMRCEASALQVHLGLDGKGAFSLKVLKWDVKSESGAREGILSLSIHSFIH